MGNVLLIDYGSEGEGGGRPQGPAGLEPPRSDADPEARGPRRGLPGVAQDLRPGHGLARRDAARQCREPDESGEDDRH